MDRPRLTAALWSTFVVLAPVALLANPSASFYYDWNNHLWFIGYFGEFFRQHVSFPEFLHTLPVAGMPHPVFYGYLLYPLLGILSSVLGAALALRVGLLLLLAAEFLALRAACTRIFGKSPLAHVVPAVVLWSVYALTNLYNRCAIPEFFAASLLFSSVSLFVAAALEPALRRRLALAWLAAFAAILMAGSHPPTALLGSPLIILLAIALLRHAWKHTPRDDARALSLTAAFAFLAGAVLLAPWLHASFSLSDSLGISSKYRGLAYFPLRCDSLAGRFSPFPFDAGSWPKPDLASTPFLEAPFDIALLLLALVSSWIALTLRPQSVSPQRLSLGRLLLLLGWLWFFALGALSLFPAAGAAVSFLAPAVQFAYRFVSHANLGLLLACFGAGILAADSLTTLGRFRRLSAFCAGGALLLASTALAVKLAHGQAVASSAESPAFSFRGDRSPLVTEGHPATAPDYATPSRFTQLPPEIAASSTTVRFPVGAADSTFGLLSPLSFKTDSDAWVFLNCTAFPWASVRIDGLPPSATASRKKDFRLAVFLPAGAHRAEWNWCPPPAWTVLRRLSVALLPVCCLISLASLVSLTSVPKTMAQPSAQPPSSSESRPPSDRTVYRIVGWRRLLVWPLAFLVKLWTRSLRFEIDDASFRAFAKNDEPIAFVLWHNRLFLAGEIARRYRGGRKVHALVSASTDGAWLDAFFSQVGLATVRGSSSRLGREAATGLIDVLRNGGDIGITPDGPRGPCYDFKGGAIIVPRRTNTPILLMGGRFYSSWRLRSWDRFYLPRPFSKVKIFGEIVPASEFSGDREAAAAQLRTRLLAINPD